MSLLSKIIINALLISNYIQFVKCPKIYYSKEFRYKIIKINEFL